MTGDEWLKASVTILGVGVGILCAFLSTRKADRFKTRFLNELRTMEKEGTLSPYVDYVLNNPVRWKRSFRLIRKPFEKHVSLAIETAALIYAFTGLVNAFVRFQEVFGSPSQGYAAIAFIGLIIGFIPSEYIMSGRIEKEMDHVLEDLKAAREKDQLERYIIEMRRQWK
ncbi:MAG: hypothetical protein AB9873_15825 [Syntrophobacteraceae bacterium]